MKANEMSASNSQELATQSVNTCEESKTITTHVLTFLTFAEYMGYVSEYIEDIDNWLDGTPPSLSVQIFLNVEARDILEQMKKDYEINDIRQWWDEYYKIILFKSDDILKKLKIQTVNAANI